MYNIVELFQLIKFEIHNTVWYVEAVIHDPAFQRDEEKQHAVEITLWIA